MAIHGSSLWFRAVTSLLVIGITASAGYLLAENGGTPGKTTRGCNCHENLPNVNGVVTVSIDGPQVVAPSSVSDYTISVTGGPSGTYGGFDLAATGGILIPGAGTRIASGELVHSEPTNRTWSFQWQAPATDGVYGFLGVGQACNADGDNSGDSWNYYGGSEGAQFAVTVSSAIGVEDLPVAVASLSPAWPNPFAIQSHVAFDLPAASSVQLEVYDPSGRLIATLVSSQLPAGRHVATWNGRKTEGSAVPNGIYFLRLKTELGVSSQRIVKTAR